MSAFETPVERVALNHRELESVFHEVFEQSYRTRLVGGGEEPLYQPATTDHDFHQIIYTRDYAASALHEIAHWCVAGTERRKLEDYGYWYAPDGRDEQQQTLFERVEVRPQAMEWIFSIASGRDFRVSADNLEAELGASESFKDAIFQQVQQFCAEGLPPRAHQFAQALAARTGLCTPLAPEYFPREGL
ncbi:elongation factor P hydroxylase [Pseudomaricurvus sp.]|uniref:elongation factor P hydroxylase n=1 Tax=Pseudomaricurvus sp. TaxID=2004510 RepID=UPI003F6D22BF